MELLAGVLGSPARKRGQLRLIHALAHQMTARAGLYRDGTDFAFTDAHVTVPADQWPRVKGLARTRAGAVRFDT